MTRAFVSFVVAVATFAISDGAATDALRRSDEVPAAVRIELPWSSGHGRALVSRADDVALKELKKLEAPGEDAAGDGDEGIAPAAPDIAAIAAATDRRKPRGSAPARPFAPGVRGVTSARSPPTLA